MESFLLSSGDNKPRVCPSYVSGISGVKTGACFEAPRVIVAIPAYNEEVAIGSLILRTMKYADEVVVVDDGSADHTAEVARLAGARVIAHEKNEGKGAGIRDAFSYARVSGASVLVVMDGDGQHDPDEIPLLLRPILERRADLVNGSRFLSEKQHNVPGYRRIGQGILDIATNAGTGRKITDTQNGFRAFSEKTFESFSFRQNGMAIESEMLMDAAAAGLQISEVPINVRYDVDGSTYNPLVHGLSVLGSVIRLVLRRRPILFFCLPGTFLIGAGAIFALTLVGGSVVMPGMSGDYVLVTPAFILAGAVLVSVGLALSSSGMKTVETNRQESGKA